MARNLYTSTLILPSSKPQLIISMKVNQPSTKPTLNYGSIPLTPSINTKQLQHVQHQTLKWNILQRVAAIAFDTLETALVSWETRIPLPKTIDPRVQISGNFAPVQEQSPTHNLKVNGTMPDCLNGVYVRNGANPLYEPISGHHLFDGDGMVHAVSIHGNSVSYSCKLTETHRLMHERETGHPVFPKAIGELHGHFGVVRLILLYARSLFGFVDPNKGMGVANAGLIYFNNRLLAMSEDDLPYHIRVTSSLDIETVGRYDFYGTLGCAMIAHPKIDPVSGEMFALSYDVVRKPYLKYFKFSKDGRKSKEVEIGLDVPTMVHDFAITENYVVVPDQQVVFKLGEMIKGGSPVVYDKNKMSRFGILSKIATTSDDMIWVDSPETFCFHFWNAWEEPKTNEVIVIGSCMNPPDSIFNDSNNSHHHPDCILSEIRINLKTRKSTKRPILQQSNQLNLEAGMVNRYKLGRKTRFAYLAIAEPWPKVCGFAKVDLVNGEIKKLTYGEERYGGEPFFVPNGPNSEREDDGYVLVFVHDEKTWKSELWVVNAITMEMEACVKLPSRVPYGFHGTFISEKDLAQQA